MPKPTSCATELEPVIKPTRNRITALIKNKAEKIAAGLLDHFLSAANLIATSLAGRHYDSHAVHQRGQRGGVRRDTQTRAVNQHIVEVPAQGLDARQAIIRIVLPCSCL